MNYEKDFRVLPIVPFDTGVTLRGVPGPLVILGADLTKVHPMIQEALEECLRFELAMAEQNRPLVITT